MEEHITWRKQAPQILNEQKGKFYSRIHPDILGLVTIQMLKVFIGMDWCPNAFGILQGELGG